MKTLEINEMENIQGGDGLEFVDGACAVIGVAGVVGYFAAALNPFTAAVAGFCAGWTFGRSMPL